MFKIYFPMVETRGKYKAGVPALEEAVPKGREAILIVEDDPSLRDVTCEFLRSSGYFVLAAASPEEALRLSEAHKGTIEFLLTDVIMPQMNGRELAAKLNTKRPHLRVLYVSGYADGIIREGTRGVLEPGLAFLQKPYTRHALTRKIREMLDVALVKSTANKH